MEKNLQINLTRYFISIITKYIRNVKTESEGEKKVGKALLKYSFKTQEEEFGSSIKLAKQTINKLNSCVKKYK